MEGYARLITTIYKKDGLNQNVKTGEKAVDIYVEEISISQNEFYKAGSSGHKAQCAIKTAFCNYSGEQECEYKGVRYYIYRTYKKSDDEIELYLEERAGVSDVN